MSSPYIKGNEPYNSFLLNDEISNNNSRHSRFANRNPLYSLKNNETVKNIVNNEIVKGLKHLQETNDDDDNNNNTLYTNSRYNYSYIFASVCRIRFKFLIARFLVTLAVFSKFFDYVFLKTAGVFIKKETFPHNSYFLVSVLKWSAKLTGVYLAFLVIELTRKNYLHVSYKKHSFVKRVQKFAHYELGYLLSFCLLTVSLDIFSSFYSNFESKTMTAMSIFSVTTVYTLKHLICDGDRLVFVQGSEFYQNPQSFIKNNCYKKIISSLKLSLLTTAYFITVYVLTVKIGFEFFYQLLVDGIFLRFVKYCFNGKQTHSDYINNIMILNGNYRSHYNSEDLKYLASRNIHKQGLSNAVGGKSSISFLSLTDLMSVWLINLCIIFIWEILNISFNAYLSMGPLHKGKLISLMSSGPIDTLVDGLRNKNSFTRLTAFQELSLRSQLKLKGTIVENIYRNSIYNSKNNWFNILNECLKTIKETNNKIVEYNLKLNFKKDSVTYLNKLSMLQKNKNLENLLQLQENERLFGKNLSSLDDLDLIKLNDEYLEKKNQIWKDNIENLDNTILTAFDKNGSYRNYDASKKTMSERHEGIKNAAVNRKEDESYLADNLIMKYVYPSLKRFFDQRVKKFLFPDVEKPVLTLQPELKTNYDTKFNNILRTVLGKISFITNSSLTNTFYVTYTNYLLEEDAQEVCPLPAVYAEAVFSMCSLLVCSLEESPRSYVVSSIAKILKTYQISSVILGEYCDLVSQERGNSKAQPTSIEILYDIVLASFLEVVTKYKDLLKDVDLDADVEDLIRCVLE